MDVRFRDLRRTYASWLVDEHVPLTSIRDLLGHSSIAVTERYLLTLPNYEADAEVTDAIDRKLAS
jgi:integrase